jgi:hypothetical protein
MATDAIATWAELARRLERFSALRGDASRLHEEYRAVFWGRSIPPAECLATLETLTEGMWAILAEARRLL